MRIRRNIFLFKLYNLFGELWPLSALSIVYFQQISGSYALALGIFSIADIVQSLSEVPTGIISDKMGRRRTLIASSLGFLGAFLLFALAGSFGDTSLLIFGGVIWGISMALCSGTDEAFMYETMQELGRPDEYDILYARSHAFGQIGLACGAAIGAFVTYFYSLTALAWVSVFVGGLYVFVTLFFVEPSTVRATDKTGLSHCADAWRNFINNKKLRMLAVLQMLNKGIGFTSHRLESAYFNSLIPMWMVNIARIMKQVCGMVSFFVAPYVRRFGFYRMLIGSKLCSTMVQFVAVTLNNFATPFIQSCVNLFYGVTSTAGSALIQNELSSAQRATMGSIVSLMGGIMSAVLYVGVGLIADMSSVYIALILLICGNLFVTGGYYYMLKHHK